MPSADDFSGKPWALQLGAMFVAAFALIVLLAFSDHAARANLEAVKDRGPAAEKR